MYIGGLSYAGTLSRPATTPSSWVEPESGNGETAQESPGYFRTISSISHASLASAYQAMRAHDITMVPVNNPLPGEPNREPSVVEGTIASGGGIPSAMNAYSEIIEDADIG